MASGRSSGTEGKKERPCGLRAGSAGGLGARLLQLRPSLSRRPGSCTSFPRLCPDLPSWRQLLLIWLSWLLLLPFTQHVAIGPYSSAHHEKVRMIVSLCRYEKPEACRKQTRTQDHKSEKRYILFFLPFFLSPSPSLSFFPSGSQEFV